jgi:urease
VLAVQPFSFFVFFSWWVVLRRNVVRAQGDPNASIPTVQPVIARPMFAPMVPATSVLFVSQASVTSGVVGRYGLRKRVEPVKDCRGIGKKDMKFNDVMPRMKVDPERYTVEADGVTCVAEPADELPLTQSWFVY